MSKRICHYKVKLPVEFVPFIKPDTSKIGNYYHIFIKKDEIDPKFNSWLASYGLEVAWGLFLNSAPYGSYTPHLEESELGGNCVKLNIIFNSSDTKMKWYDLLPGEKGESNPNMYGTNVFRANPAKCEIVHEANVNENCLLDAGTIHDLKNGFNQGKDRQCYSLILKRISENKPISWNNAVDVLGPILEKL